MPKDTREVLRGFTVVVDGKQRTITDFDEIAARFTQKELDEFVERGLLEGEWKSTKKDDPSGLPTGILSLEETTERFGNMDFSDQVINSLRFHKSALAENVGTLGITINVPNTSANEWLKAAKENQKPDSGKEIGSGSEGEGGKSVNHSVQTKFTAKDLQDDQKDELLTKVDELRKDGFVLDVSDKSTKAVIIEAILNAKKGE